jgi:imidazolonepropionase-like amidohydrolase
VELKNGRFADVVQGSYFDPAFRLIIRGSKIEALTGPTDRDSGIKADLTIDCQGKTVLPGLPGFLTPR